MGPKGSEYAWHILVLRLSQGLKSTREHKFHPWLCCEFGVNSEPCCVQQDGHRNKPASLPSPLQQNRNGRSWDAQDTEMSALSAPNSLIMANRPQWPHGSICRDREKLTCIFCHDNIGYVVCMVWGLLEFVYLVGLFWFVFSNSKFLTCLAW